MPAQPHSYTESLTNLLTRICETPAPTFEEHARALLIGELLAEAGLNPEQDEVGNVIADVPGGEGPKVMLAAHLDTVFEASTVVKVSEDDGKLHAPGIGDNSSSLTVLVQLARVLMREDRPRANLTLVATVGEEGLGNLRGARHVVKTHGHNLDGFIALDGYLGVIINKSVGSKRYKITFRGPGGHAWGDFPGPSATHALGAAVYGLSQLEFSGGPRWSWNVGKITGGTSINTIAEQASMYLDLRSTDPTRLAQLTHKAHKHIATAANRHRVEHTIDLIGDRPCASVENDRLVQTAKQALAATDISAHLAVSSTDANAAMAAGIPAITFGVYKGGHAHRLSEWIDPSSLAVGLTAVLNLVDNLRHVNLTAATSP
ncbi:MAG: M20/M25/M40 family metallo-hydrolase [Deinococcota bacterium]